MKNLIKHLVENKDVSTEKEAKELVKAVFGGILTTMKAQDEVAIHGFGKFVIEQKGERTCRNPATGEQITVSPKGVVKFKASSVLKEAVK